MHDLVIRSKAVYTPRGPRSAAVVVDGRVVTSVLEPDAAVTAREEVRLDGDEVLIPGVVDSHVHVNEPGRTEWRASSRRRRQRRPGE